MSNKRFGGLDLKTIVDSTQAKPPAATHTAQVPIGELAVRGASTVPHERQTILLVDPKRCRPWRLHNRHPNWYTREKCADLIHGLSHEEQIVPALGRKLSGDPDYDFEVIFGMRRRFACEVLGKQLKLRLTQADDKICAVLMHQENANRKDITMMERAISYARQLKEGVFESQDEIAGLLDLSKGQVAKYVAAAELIESPPIARLFPDPVIVPVKAAYEISLKMADARSKEAIEKKAYNLASSDQIKELSPTQVLKLLLGAPERSVKAKIATPLQKQYNVGPTGKMKVTRNAKGKVTLAFPEGLDSSIESEVLEVVKLALKDLSFPGETK